MKFSIRTLCLLAVPVAIFAAWLKVYRLDYARNIELVGQQGMEVRTLQTGVMAFLMPHKERHELVISKAWKRGELAKISEWLPNVTEISIKSNVRSEHLAEIQEFALLESVFIVSAEDVDVDVLCRCERLSSIALHGVSFTGKSLDLLEGLQKLVYLDLSFSGVSDTTASHLNVLKTVRSLDLSDCKVGDRIVENICEIPLESLDLKRSMVTSASLPHIAKMEHLQELAIDCDSVGSDLSQLAGLKLRTLYLDRMELDANGIPKLGPGMPGATKVEAHSVSKTIFLSGDDATDNSDEVVGQVQDIFREMESELKSE